LKRENKEATEPPKQPTKFKKYLEESDDHNQAIPEAFGGGISLVNHNKYYKK
jgi:hypothetical protein